MSLDQTGNMGIKLEQKSFIGDISPLIGPSHLNNKERKGEGQSFILFKGVEDILKI